MRLPAVAVLLLVVQVVAVRMVLLAPLPLRRLGVQVAQLPAAAVRMVQSVQVAAVRMVQSVQVAAVRMVQPVLRGVLRLPGERTEQVLFAISERPRRPPPVPPTRTTPTHCTAPGRRRRPLRPRCLGLAAERRFFFRASRGMPTANAEDPWPIRRLP